MRKTFLTLSLIVLGMTLLVGLLPEGFGQTAHAGAWGGVRQQMFFAFPAPPPRAESHDRRDTRMTVRDQENIRKTFDLGSSAHALDVDNVNGSIRIVGTDSNLASLLVNKTLRAVTDRDLERARKEVTLEIKQDAGSLSLFVDGPFRCRCGEEGRHSVNFRDDDRDYVVQMDFELQVPRNSDVRLSTVNSGKITVEEIRGAYRVRNVNGDIEMFGIAGSGSAHTVNGALKVIFHENPRQASSFKSINGDIDLFFARGLSADFRFKNFNGEIYSDFIVTSLPVRGIQEERDGRRHIFRADRFTGGRVGAGGVEIQTENLNGDIRIRENQ